jgi:hypothetical protein
MDTEKKYEYIGKSWAVRVSWGIEDVEELNPNLEYEECEEILNRSWGQLEEAAVREGWKVLEEAVFQFKERS